MHGAQRLTRAALVLGIVGLVLTGLEILALLDIVQGAEPDLALEWTVVWFAVPMSALAQVLFLIALARSTIPVFTKRRLE